MTRMMLLFFASAFVLSACTPTIASRGNLVSDDQIGEVISGFHTRSDVLRYMGSPTTKAPFDENVWYYIGQETAKKGILDPKIVAERVVQVTFDAEGTVLEVVDLDAQHLNLPVERSKTATHGNEITFMQQLLGNVGRFNPATAGQGSGL